MHNAICLSVIVVSCRVFSPKNTLCPVYSPQAPILPAANDLFTISTFCVFLNVTELGMQHV